MGYILLGAVGLFLTTLRIAEGGFEAIKATASLVGAVLGATTAIVVIRRSGNTVSWRHVMLGTLPGTLTAAFVVHFPAMLASGAGIVGRAAGWGLGEWIVVGGPVTLLSVGLRLHKPKAQRAAPERPSA